MSATNFFLSKGDIPFVARIPVAAVSVAAYTPAASMRVFLTGFAVSSNVAGTIKLLFGGGAGIFEGISTGSAMINSPHGFMALSPGYDESVYFTSKASATDGYVVNLYGFVRP